MRTAPMTVVPLKSPRLRRRGPLPLVVSLLCLVIWTSTGLAQIPIEGVTDKKVYQDRVSFVVRSEPGFQTTATLNGEAVPLDVSVEVGQAEYYELQAIRIDLSTQAEESQRIQFIVRASERKNSEWGLRPWTPYPTIDSAAAEFAGARLEIVTPAAYPADLEIPVVARVEDEFGKRLGVNGTVTIAGVPDAPLRLLRGVGSVFLLAAMEPNVISCTAAIQSLTTTRPIAVEAITIWQVISGDIAASADWGPNARIRITGGQSGAATIAAEATLTIGAGSVVVVDPDVTIVVHGRIVVDGTNERPVVFTTRDRTLPWGGFVFESDASEGRFTGTILTASGADSDWFDNHPGYGHSHRHEQCLFYVSDGAHVALTDCYLVENHGQAGHGESGYLTMTGCLVQKCITAGQYNGGVVALEDCALIEFPSATAAFADDDNDGLYLTGGAHTLTDCLIGWALDDGIDAGSGSGGSVTVENCWFESCYHEAMAWSESRDATVTDTVTLNSGQGIECGFGSPDVNAVHCLSTANLVGARFGDNYDWSYGGFLKVADSLLLFNQRDVWGRAWDNWEVHLDQMDLQDNILSIPNANFPANTLWDPAADPNQAARLVSFLPSPADTVGVGLATQKDVLDLSELAGEIPVRLSTFTPQTVAVDYTVEADDGYLDTGTLTFVPGQTVRHIPIVHPNVEELYQLRVTLSNPVGAELTRYAQITYQGSSEITTALIRAGDEWRYFKGTQEPPADWNALAFDDSAWLTGATGIGYEASSGYQACIATALDDMQDNYVSVYARREFVIEDLTRLMGLTLTMAYDDGYIVYLNGAPVDSQNAPDPPVYDERASGSHEADCGAPETIDLSDHLDKLLPGVNVLALQAHNRSAGSSDFIFIPQLFSIRAR